MKLKVKVKLSPGVCMPQQTEKGDWIDLHAAAECNVATPTDVRPYTLIPLGVAMKLPAGCYAELAPRSSTPKNFRIWCPISIGVIDASYCGNDDVWKFPAAPIGCESTRIHQNDRICQFTIKLSQKATIWQKLRWLLSSGIELEQVDDLGTAPNRGGFGTTGMDAQQKYKYDMLSNDMITNR